jgi:hypothetical protein
MDRPRGARGLQDALAFVGHACVWTVDTVVALQLLLLERSDHESFQGGIGIMGNHGKHSNIATYGITVTYWSRSYIYLHQIQMRP